MNKKVFITKYALTSGIIECEMDVTDDLKSCWGKPPGWSFPGGFYGEDFHLTREEAEVDFYRRKEKKISSLKKSMSIIEKLEFKT